MKRLATAAALVLATLLGVYLLWQFRSAAWLFLLSLALAAAARPFASDTAGRGFRHTAALLAVYLLGGLVVVAVLYSVGTASFDELQRAGDAFVAAYDRLWAEWPNGSGLQQTVVQWLPPPDDLYQTVASEQLTVVLRGMVGVTLSVLDLLSQAGVVVMLSLYWNMDRVRLERLWLSLLAPSQRTRARNVWQEIESAVGAYVRGQLLASLAAGLFLGLGYWQMGLEFPTLLALSASVARFIPWLGAVLGVLPVLLAGLQIGPGIAALAALYTLVVFFVVSLLESALAHRRYSSLLIALVMIALVDVFGLVGVLLAPPTAAAIQVILSHLMPSPVSTAAGEAEVTHQLVDLEGRLAMVRASLAAAPGPPATAHLVQRLAQLLERARVVL